MIMLSLLAVMAMHNAGTWAPAAREFRGAWVATVDNIDWPSKRTLSTSQQQAELIAILDKARALHLNAIIFQVRPSADALYASKLEPWSEYLTGQQGRPPNPYWDPLEFAIREAHKRGLQLHAWFNPYRAYHPTAKGPLASNHISKTHPEAVKPYGKLLWMDPSDPYVQNHSLAVIEDVVRRYDIDGVHIDDYFYPYPIQDANKREVPFPDDRTWNAYVASGGKLSKGAWRRQSVDQFIQRMYVGVKRIKPWVMVGISPFGIYRPGVPSGIQAGVDQYGSLYADVKKWLQNGWCDYLAPQLYWKIAQPPQSYPVLLKWWCDVNSKGRLIVAGNYTSRLDKGVSDWPLQELIDQISITRKEERAAGNIHFSMKALQRGYKGIDQALAQGPYTMYSLPPATSWLGSQKPAMPLKIDAVRTGADCIVDWSPPIESKNVSYALYASINGGWKLLTSTSETQMRVRGGENFDQFAVTTVSRTGIESDPAFSAMAGSR